MWLTRENKESKTEQWLLVVRYIILEGENNRQLDLIS